MFGRNKKKLRAVFDDLLLETIDYAAADWESAKQTQQAVREADSELIAQTELAGAKYEFLYLEARRRKVKGHVQASIIDH
ncbi:YaaL family protein [Liquorilactobacillus uvarum]|uniref:YaaL family protein n=1 Tax=Liquorilactobacillus uvarum TaxID=303240 RepID=UPI00070BDCF8|nr:YaaL family protein [Liquorilactobacillus uvarum]